MRRLAEHRVRVIGWSLDLSRAMHVDLDEDAYALCEAVDAALFVVGDPLPPEPPPVALIWTEEARCVRLVILRGGGPAEVQLEGITGRRVQVGRDPVAVTLISQAWSLHAEAGWVVRAWGGAPDTLALLTIASSVESDGAWANAVVRSLRFGP